MFHVRFWTTKPPDFGPNPNKLEKSAPTRLRHLMATENTQKSNPPTALRTRYCMCYRRSFFRRSRLFFREAAFSSGSEGCEWRASAPPWARVEIKLKMSLRLYLHSSFCEGLQPSHPRPPTFCSLPYPPKPPNLTKSSSRYQK